MRTEKDVRDYDQNLQRDEAQLENELLRLEQQQQLEPNANHQQSPALAERDLLVIRAKLAILEWVLADERVYIPRD